MPIYMNAKDHNKGMDSTTKNWILGKIIMEDYYSVFDLSNTDQLDKITIKMGEKNTQYQKNNDIPGGGGDQDKPSNNDPTK